MFDTERLIYMIKRDLHDLEVENDPTQQKETYTFDTKSIYDKKRPTRS